MGVGVLVATGIAEERARSLIGRWRKAHSDGEVLNALVQCRARAISNPVEWLTKRLKGARYVSESGFEYHGSLEAIRRKAEERRDMPTYWAVCRDIREEAEARQQQNGGSHVAAAHH